MQSIKHRRYPLACSPIVTVIFINHRSARANLQATSRRPLDLQLVYYEKLGQARLCSQLSTDIT